MKTFSLIFLAIFSFLTASAYDFADTNDDGITLYFNFLSHSDRTCEITYGDKKYTGDIVIPSVVSFDNMPYSVIAIGKEAFQYAQLTSISIPVSVTEIKTSAFSWCSLKYIDIPSSVTHIETWAFEHSSLESLVLPNSITEFTGGGFSYFSNCPYLASVVLPTNLKIIPSRMFEGCSVLSQVVFPENLERIDTDAFADCPNLKSISLPKSLLSISWRAFENSGLETIYCYAVTPPNLASDAFKNISKTVCHLKVPTNSVDFYKSSDYWNEFYYIEPLDDDEPTANICSTPDISLVNGKLLVSSSTSGASCHTSISSPDFTNFNTQSDELIELYGIYTISAFCSAPGYRNSETIKATLIWYNPSLNSGINELQMDSSKSVLVSTQNNIIFVQGLDSGEVLNLYGTNGQLIHKETAVSTSMNIHCSSGIYILNIGNKSFKVYVK